MRKISLALTLAAVTVASVPLLAIGLVARILFFRRCRVMNKHGALLGYVTAGSSYEALRGG